MQVICINENWIPTEEQLGEPAPKFLEECEVLDHKTDSLGDLWYSLGGRFNRTTGFRADHFAILPDATADEMSEEVREDIVTIETPVV